ncbi:MAG TPA: hypothetical protein VFU43_20025 [Streptosporangiaceae bacterium]|nr:hypothetical protein [Streptosporangiaceae bacterium]
MYTVKELIGELGIELFHAPTHEAALDHLDEECRCRFHQLAANGEGGRIRYHFEIYDDAGALVNCLHTTPRLEGPTLREIYDIVQHDSPRRRFE